MIKENKKYYGEMVRAWEESDLNCYVITGPQQGGAERNTPVAKIGRVVQVRLESGQFGSDTVFLRHANDSLTTHENQAFWKVPGEFKSYLDECFKDAYVDDPIEYEYTIGKELPEKGFIVSSTVPEGESTPMRDIKASLHKSISKLTGNGS